MELIGAEPGCSHTMQFCRAMPAVEAGADLGKLEVEEAGEEEGKVRAVPQAQGRTPSHEISA